MKKNIIIVSTIAVIIIGIGFLYYILTLQNFSTDIETTQNNTISKNTAPSNETTIQKIMQPDNEHIIVTTSTVQEETDTYIRDLAYPQTNNENINKTVKNFIDSQITFYNDTFEELGEFDIPGGKYGHYIDFSTLEGQQNTISFVLQENTYEGGAHPNTIVYTFVFDKTSGLERKFDSFFDTSDRYLDFLAQEIERIIREQTADKSMLDTFWFEDGLAPKVENFETFAVTDERIIFYFSPYILAPYARGTITAALPYTETNGDYPKVSN